MNFLVPSTVSTGLPQIKITNNGLSGAAVPVNVDSLVPAFFTLGTDASIGNIHVAAENADGTLIGPAATIKNAADVSFAGLVGTVSPNLRDEPALLFQDLQASSLTTPCA
jgi:uncharacterized protein (TIGR03437 family)